jgi:hypothetical protein
MVDGFKVLSEVPETARRIGRIDYDALFVVCLDNPGKWIKYPEPVSGSADGIRKGVVTDQPPGNYEVKTRRKDEEGVLAVLEGIKAPNWLYVRYTPPVSFS